MTKTTTRRLFAVMVALLVVCSIAGGPAVVAAAGTGTVGEDVDRTLSSDDSTDDSDDTSNDDSSDDTSDDDSSDGDDSTNRDEDTADGDSGEDASADDGSTDDPEDDGTTAENVTDDVVSTVEDTGDTVEDTTEGVDGTVDDTTDSGFTLVGALTDTTGLDVALALPTAGYEETERAGDGGDTATEHYGSADVETADTGDATGGPAVATLPSDTTTTETGPADSGLEDGEPLPVELSGGGALGLGALAAVAVARSSPLLAGSTASGSTGVGGYLSTLLDKVKPFAFPLRYSRYDDSDPLEHDAREMVYEIVNDTPGSYLSEVSEQAGLPLSTTRHHMKVLEREELVSGAKLRGKRRFYPAYAEGIELAAALNDESTASIIDALARLGAASVSDLADDLGRDPSTISHHLQRLEEDEIIVRERQGRAVMNKLSSEARTALEPETTPRPGEAAEALAD